MIILKYLDKHSQDYLSDTFFRDNIYKYTDKVSLIKKLFPSSIVDWEIDLQDSLEIDVIYFNFLDIQKTWYNEHIGSLDINTKITLSDIFKIQLSRHTEDLILVSHPSILSDTFPEILDIIKGKTLIAHYGAPINYKYLKEYKFIFAINQHLVKRIKNAGFRNVYELNHSFPSSLVNLHKNKRNSSEVSFIGSIIKNDSLHLNRLYFLNYLSNKTPIKIYSASISDDAFISYLKYKYLLFRDSFLKIKSDSRSDYINYLKVNIVSYKLQKKSFKPSYGLKFYDLLASSLVTLNHHIPYTGTLCANMRLYEATGVGTCLLTDHQDDINNYFEPDYEVVTYRTKEEAAEKIHFLANNPNKANNIARNGKRKTCASFTSKQQSEKFYDIVKSNI